MLVLKNIVKEYETAGESVTALKGVTLAFRKNEFVSILGHSGCGKTTMLNVIGGLDRYSSGDLVIRGISTEAYKESDWDTYRNHSVGFVFQSYNLIPHQTVLSNVELALTLSGVSKSERRERAIEVLKKVGLGDQIHKKPNQMSGGQMQRVAIARALINDPEILLADEPTGALDTETSVQIMELLKEISSDRLIIMVTHNPELAEQYSDRIIRLSDGEVVGDTNPFTLEDEAEEMRSLSEKSDTANSNEHNSAKSAKTSMSFFTALSLSLNNLMTKKGRTFMTAFAGSIGIIGIALILSLSNGISSYIDKIQEDTLASYPIEIEAETVDLSGLISSLMGSRENSTEEHEDGKIYSSTVLYDLITTMNSTAVKTNNLKSFKEYLESDACEIMDYATYIQYGYNLSINAYLKDTDGDYFKADVSSLFSGMMSDYSSSSSFLSTSQSFANYTIWEEMLGGEKDDELVSDIILSQYDLLDGKWPEKYDEAVLLVSGNNEISDITLYALGLISSEEMMETMIAAIKGSGDIQHESHVYDYSDIIGISYQLVASTDFFNLGSDGLWYNIAESNNETELNNVIAHGAAIKIVGIIRQKEDATSAALSGSLIYTKALTNYLLDIVENSDVVAAQKADESIDIFTGLPFVLTDEDKVSDDKKALLFKEYVASLSDAKKAELFTSIITTPTKEYITSTSMAMLSAYGITRDMEYDEMLNVVVNFAGETEDERVLIEMYLSTFTKDELYDYIVEIFGSYISSEYTASAMVTVDAIKNTPTKTELNAEKSIIYFTSLSQDSKVAFLKALANSFKESDFDSSFVNVVVSLSERADSMTEAQLIYEFTQLIRQSAIYDGVTNNACSALEAMLTRDNKLAYILGIYTSTTALPYETVYSYLVTLDDSEINSLFNQLVSDGATDNYSTYCASNQSDDAVNAKLAAALDQYINTWTDEQLISYYDEYMELVSKNSLVDNYTLIGYAEKDDPSTITIYASNFENKEKISELIEKYNETVDEDDKISYTDYVALLLSSITSVIQAISYVLIAFVSISLVVSSIMIGIITYISVLERTKEIGILRAIGASRKDISRVFNAETLIEGFTAGAIGIIVTLLLNIPISIIIKNISGIPNIASLPWIGAIALIAISVILTVIAGLIPSGVAAKKDPVVALRSE